MAKGQAVRNRLEDLIRIKEALARGDLALASRDLDAMIERTAAYFRRVPASPDVWGKRDMALEEMLALAHAEVARALPVPGASSLPRSRGHAPPSTRTPP